MKNRSDINWLTMKQVCERSGIRASTISRYKDIFSDFIRYRYNASTMLEFDERCIPVFQKIYEIYRDRSAGRRTTEKVKEILFDLYQEQGPIIDVTELTTITPLEAQNFPAELTPFIHYLKAQEERLAALEKQNRTIIDHQDQLLAQQGSMQQTMNQHLSLLSEVARSHMVERKKTFWERLFGKDDKTIIDTQLPST